MRDNSAEAEGNGRDFGSKPVPVRRDDLTEKSECGKAGSLPYAGGGRLFPEHETDGCLEAENGGF